MASTRTDRRMKIAEIVHHRKQPKNSKVPSSWHEDVTPPRVRLGGARPLGRLRGRRESHTAPLVGTGPCVNGEQGNKSPCGNVSIACRERFTRRPTVT
jgi:hypothetical protein